MIAFDIHGYRFQVRAAAVILHDSHVLLHRVRGDSFWALPGGRVHAGEPAAAAVVREMIEETGERVDVAELLFTAENFFAHQAKRYHEVGFYFRATLRAGSPLHDTRRVHEGVEGDRLLEFRWFPLAAMDALDVRPAFLRRALLEPRREARHFVEQDRSPP